MKRLVLAALLFVAFSTPVLCASYDELNAGIENWTKEQWDFAIAHFDKAISAGDLGSDLMRVAYYDRGRAHDQKGETEKAIADLAAALALKPGDIPSLVSLAYAYAEASEPDKAAAALSLAQSANPKNNSIVFDSGLVNWQLDRMSEANTAFERIQKEDHYSYGWLWLQLTNLKLGKAMTSPASAKPEPNVWPQPVIAFYQGDINEEALLKAAENADTSGDQICEANFYAAEWRSLHGDSSGARTLMAKVVSDCSKVYPEYRMAKFEMKKSP